MFLMWVKKMLRFTGQACTQTKFFERFIRLGGGSKSQQGDGKPVGLPLQFAGSKVGMLLQEKAVDSLMQTVVPQLMGAYETLPFRRQIVVYDDKSAPQLTEVEPFGRFP